MTETCIHGGNGGLAKVFDTVHGRVAIPYEDLLPLMRACVAYGKERR